MGTDANIDSDNDDTYTCYHTSGSARVGLILQGVAVPPFPCPESLLILFLGAEGKKRLADKVGSRTVGQNRIFFALLWNCGKRHCEF